MSERCHFCSRESGGYCDYCSKLICSTHVKIIRKGWFSKEIACCPDCDGD